MRRVPRFKVIPEKSWVPNPGLGTLSSYRHQGRLASALRFYCACPWPLYSPRVKERGQTCHPSSHEDSPTLGCFQTTHFTRCYLPFLLIRDRFITSIMHVSKMPRGQPLPLPGARSQSKSWSRFGKMRLPDGSTLTFPVTLYWGCRLFLALCVLRLGVTLICYLHGDDLSWQVHVHKLLQGATSAQPSQELQPTPPSSTSSHRPPWATSL